jgi:5-methyltetrahydropteroyltriglutamate--homocysteine methyltransferase
VAPLIDRLRGLPLLPTTLVGSYAQPGWLVDRDRLTKNLPVRIRRRELWRVDADALAEAQDDAVALAVFDQLRAGIDIVTDGEMRRESYSNRFATALGGLDHERPGVAVDRTGAEVAVPRVVGPIERVGSVEAPHVGFLRSLTDKPLKVTVPGPFTLACQAQDDYYGDPAELAAAYADAVRAEVLDLFEAGADIVQLDEPYLQARPERARDHGVAAIDRALAGVGGPGRRTALHVCFGYGAHVADKPSGYSFLAELARSTVDEISIEAAQPRLDLAVLASLPTKRIELGVLDLRNHEVERPEHVAERLRDTLGAMGAGGAERLVVAPDCGMKYLPRAVAAAKLAAMCAGAQIARARLAR